MMRRPIVIKSRLVPKRFCVNLLGTLWMRDPSWLSDKLVNHERIHTAQMRELLFVGFYIIYVLEWLVRLVIERNFDRAYRAISCEQEAYAHGDNLDYLARRCHFAQWRGLGGQNPGRHKKK